MQCSTDLLDWIIIGIMDYSVQLYGKIIEEQISLNTSDVKKNIHPPIQVFFMKMFYNLKYYFM